jgi:hypothetical protein
MNARAVRCIGPVDLHFTSAVRMWRRGQGPTPHRGTTVVYGWLFRQARRPESSSSNWVTFGEPDERVRTQGFELGIAAPVARAAGALYF